MPFYRGPLTSRGRFERADGFVAGTAEAEAQAVAVAALQDVLGDLQGKTAVVDRKKIVGLKAALDVLDKYATGHDDDD
jgi:hypothetical protein